MGNIEHLLSPLITKIRMLLTKMNIITRKMAKISTRNQRNIRKIGIGIKSDLGTGMRREEGKKRNAGTKRNLGTNMNNKEVNRRKVNPNRNIRMIVSKKPN